MEYRGMGRFPGQASRFRYSRPGLPIARPTRALLSTPMRARFEPPREVRPRAFTPTPRGTIQMPFRGFKATPMIPVRQHGQVSDHKTETKNDTGKDYVSPNYRGPEKAGSVTSEQNDKDKKESDTANTDSSLKQESANGGTLKSTETELPPKNQEAEKPSLVQTSDQSSFYEETSQDSSYNETANQDPYFEASNNEDSNTDQTSNQNSYFDEAANENSYFEESSNQESYSEEASYQDSFPEQGSNFDTYQGDKGGSNTGQGGKDAGGEGQEKEEEGEEESDEEDTGYCQYCNMPFDNDDAYWKHTRGLLHTQKVMEAENAKKKGQEPDKEPEKKDVITPPSFGSTMMENKASERDLKYLRLAGLSPHMGWGRGSNRGGYQPPAKDASRGWTESAYNQGQGQSGYNQGQGQYDRGTRGWGRGQGYKSQGKSYSDGTYMSGFGQRINQEEEAEGYYGYEEGKQYQGYEDQGENYKGAGDYNDGNFNSEKEGHGEEEYNFYSSNWMDMDKPPEKIPLGERDYYPDALGKQQFPPDFYCKACDVKCTSQKNFEMHVEGTKHKMKTLLGKGDTFNAKEEEKKKMVVECTSHNSKVDHLINKSDQAIVGLKYVTEFRKPDPTVRPTYVCNLCESKCDMNTVLSHVTGFRHRSNYFKECHPDIYNHMTSNTAKKKSEQNASAEEFAADCMQRDGRGKIRVKMEIDSATEAVAANLLSKSGIKMETFISDLKTKPEQPSPVPEKKARINPVLLEQDQPERSFNKRASDSQYNYTSKYPRGPGNRDVYGEPGGPKQVYDYNHKGSQSIAGYSGSDDQFNPYQGPPMGHQTGYPPEQGAPQNPLSQGDTDDEDKELFQEFLEWKRQQKKKANQGSLQGEDSSSVQQTTDKKQPDQAPDAPGSSAADMMFALSQTMIKTEEDAAMALQVSNALTQALLQYRLKNVPKELASGLTSGAGQTNPVQTTSAESKKPHISSKSKSASSRSSSRTSQKAQSTPVVSSSSAIYPQGASSSASYPHGASLSIPGAGGMTSNVAYTSSATTGVPPIADPLLQHMNPMNPSYTANPTATTQYPGTVSTTQFPGTVSAAQHPGTVSTTQYQGYPYYGGQYPSTVPEGYQWGYNTTTTPEEVPPPPPPREDLPKPPPENQTY